MITIERTNYAFATFDASPEEWKAIKAMVRHAESIYHHTELHYRLFWEEEERRSYIRQVINMMDVEGDPPIELMHSKEIHTILCCVKEMDRFDVPGLDEDDKMAIISQMEKFHIVDIFDDEKATPEQLKP
ncbi:MAG: hypothetical protein CMI63_17760 [Parvularcula sp.]|nr:hypothetical protein [Parvularcula sp.]